MNVSGRCPPPISSSDACVPTLGQKKVAETIPVAQCSPPGQASLRIGSARSTQAGEHGGFLLSYTKIFPGCIVYCTKDLVFTQIKGFICCMVLLNVEVVKIAPTQQYQR